MKKRLISVAVVLMMALLLCFSASAAGLDHVTDTVALLTAEELADLEAMAEQVTDRTGCGVYIIIVDDYEEYRYSDDPEIPSIEDAATDLYLDNELGEGSDDSGILLLLSMSNRKYALFAYGYGNTAFTDYGKDYLAGEFTDDFGDDDWYPGLQDFVRVSEEMINSALEGEPVDVGSSGSYRFFSVVICIILAFVIAFCVKAVLEGQLKSVAMETDANLFMDDAQLRLEREQDRFTHRTQSRVYDPPEKSASSSGGGTTINSSGGSSSSGSF